MSTLTVWPLMPGQSINRWHMSLARRELLPGHARRMPDVVDYRFVNGWVATGDLPCREALRGLVARRRIELDDAPTFPSIYVGGEDPRVDFSTFCFRPTLIERWARCILTVPMAQTLHFSAETCGGMHMWCNDTLCLVHEPYDRNIVHRTQFSVEVPPGASVVMVRFDDLHERDTSCFFKLTLISGREVASGLEATISPDRLRDVEATLRGLRTDRIFYETGPVRAVGDHLPSEPVDIAFGDRGGAGGAPPMNVLAGDLSGASGQVLFRVSAGSPGAELFDAESQISGCPALRFRAEIGAVALERNLGTTILRPPVVLDQPSLADRKRAALAAMARIGKDEPSRALVLLAAGGDSSDIARMIERTLVPIVERHDCADFWMLPLIWAWRHHAGTRVPDALWARVRAAILGFRYWLDEPGDDVMWFWSENHVLCFHVAQYLAGDTFPADVFPNSGKTGAQHRDQARVRLDRWFDSIEAHGLAEWNSAAYYPIDFLGLFTLMEHAPDSALAGRARALIDQIFVMTALHTIGGVPAGSQGRVYEKELLAGPATELGSIAAIAFGGPWHPGHDRASALFALTNYAPPEAVLRFARVPAGDTLEARYVQGLDQNAKLALWKSAHAQLSSVAEHRTGDPGHQQHVADIQLAAHPLARLWVNHPGDLRVWGGSRPSYWAGNGIVPRVAQYRNVALMIFDLTLHDHPIGFTHAFVPVEALGEVSAEGHWIFARAGRGYAALYGSGVPVRQENGLYAGSEWRMDGRRSAWVLVAGSADQDRSFAMFQQACRDLQPEHDADSRTVQVSCPDGRLALAFEGDLTLNGAPVAFGPLSTVPHVAMNGRSLAPWPALEASRP